MSTKDQYHVEGVPPYVKAKITALIGAADDYAFIGMHPPEEHADIEEALHIARYNLERTILTALKKASP